MPIGENIKRIRKQKNLTQKQLADKCNMQDSAIRRYENSPSAHPKIETIIKIASALDVPVLTLVGSENISEIVSQLKTDEKTVQSTKIIDDQLTILKEEVEAEKKKNRILLGKYPQEQQEKIDHLLSVFVNSSSEEQQRILDIISLVTKKYYSKWEE